MKNKKPLTKTELKQIVTELDQQDLTHAQKLSQLQDKFFETNPKIKDFNEFAEVENIKRIIRGLSTGQSDIKINFDEDEVKKIEHGINERMKKIKSKKEKEK